LRWNDRELESRVPGILSRSAHFTFESCSFDIVSIGAFLFQCSVSYCDSLVQ